MRWCAVPHVDSCGETLRHISKRRDVVAKVGGHVDGGALVKTLADQMEKALPAGLGKRRTAELIQNSEVETSKVKKRGKPRIESRFRFKGIGNGSRSNLNLNALTHANDCTTMQSFAQTI